MDMSTVPLIWVGVIISTIDWPGLVHNESGVEAVTGDMIEILGLTVKVSVVALFCTSVEKMALLFAWIAVVVVSSRVPVTGSHFRSC